MLGVYSYHLWTMVIFFLKRFNFFPLDYNIMFNINDYSHSDFIPNFNGKTFTILPLMYLM